MTVKLRLTVAALLLFLVVMVDFTSRIMPVFYTYLSLPANPYVLVSVGGATVQQNNRET
ncbi:hypothetical protein [Escherichia coli]|uniref:hypothetical protein n=1 Tax=Escherichia coli TaxID=562 RepID=UPI001593AEE8|nr:hypothetical protein [Escherichia coli]